MVSRLDLDGTYSPWGLVSKILKAEPDLKIPVPIEDLAHQLDIVEIENLKTEGFVGGLVTNEARSSGGILVQEGLGQGRRRFTIAHELCHFLIPFHKPAKAGEFLCDRAAMKRWDMKAQNTAWKMEAEANRFASLILMPTPHLKRCMNNRRYPTLATILDIHEHFNVSKEAAARAYAEYNDDAVAVIITRHGKYLYAYKQSDFPWLALRKGEAIPSNSILHHHTDQLCPSNSDPTDPADWIDTDNARHVTAMYEQVLPQSNGFAMIQLKVLLRDEDEFDPDENLTSKERYRKHQDRWST